MAVTASVATAGPSGGDGFVGLLGRHRWLIWELTKREHTDRYAGSLLGPLWAVGHPLVMMVVYIAIFSYVFKLKIGGTAELPLDYATYLMAGYLPWIACQESMNKASSVIASNANLVKQVVFPVEVLPIKGAFASAVTQLVGTLLLMAYTVVGQKAVLPTYGLIPVVLLAQLAAMVGVSLLLGAVGAYFRDLKELVQVGTVVGVYLMPVFYLPAWVPDVFRPLLYVNPFSYMVWCYQDVFYYGRVEHPAAWAVFMAGAVVTLRLGLWAFQRAKVSFGNVL